MLFNIIGKNIILLDHNITLIKLFTCNFLISEIISGWPGVSWRIFFRNTLCPSEFWFLFASVLFTSGLIGIFFNNKNFLLFLFKLEVMFMGLNLWLLGEAAFHGHTVGQSIYAYALLIFGIVAAESVIGLSLFLVFFLLNQTIVFHLYEIKQSEGRLPKKIMAKDYV